MVFSLAVLWAATSLVFPLFLDFLSSVSNSLLIIGRLDTQSIELSAALPLKELQKTLSQPLPLIVFRDLILFLNVILTEVTIF